MTPQRSSPFDGFQADDLELISIPAAFFTQLLPQMDDLNQLRLLLYMLWHVDQQDETVQYFQLEDFQSDAALARMIGGEQEIQTTLSGLINLGAVLQADLEWMDERYYFINSPQGRAAVEAIKSGRWTDPGRIKQSIHLESEKPNIFKLYEENIGPITPMIADILKMDEAAYPYEWIQEAIEIAIKNNARSWKYIQTILDRWQNQGRGNEQNRRDHSKDPDSYRKSWLKHE